MPPAARVGDLHVCPLINPGPVPHVGGPILPPGCPTVLIGGVPAARVGDMAFCVGGPDVIAAGSPTVKIGGPMAARMGDMTSHGGTITVGLPTVMIGSVGKPGALKPGSVPASCPLEIEGSALSEEQALALFRRLAARGDIAFKYPDDGCYARAHLMALDLQSSGVTPGKVWSFASSDSDPLWVDTPNHPDGKVYWGYHVAPTVPVRDANGSVRDMVVDPSLFDRPVTVEEWRNAQHDHPSVYQTPLGVPPPPAGGQGTGYWPGADPHQGPDDHAEETMIDYLDRQRQRGNGP